MAPASSPDASASARSASAVQAAGAREERGFAAMSRPRDGPGCGSSWSNRSVACPRSGKDPGQRPCPIVRDRADGRSARVLRPTNRPRSAGLPSRLSQRGPGGGRIGEAAGQQVEREQLEEDGQEEHPARRRKDGQRWDGLGKVDELLANLALSAAVRAPPAAAFASSSASSRVSRISWRAGRGCRARPPRGAWSARGAALSGVSARRSAVSASLWSR